jgi:hypothetical protein
VFGVQTAAQIDIDRTTLIERDNPLSRLDSSFILMLFKKGKTFISSVKSFRK